MEGCTVDCVGGGGGGEIADKSLYFLGTTLERGKSLNGKYTRGPFTRAILNQANNLTFASEKNIQEAHTNKPFSIKCKISLLLWRYKNLFLYWPHLNLWSLLILSFDLLKDVLGFLSRLCEISGWPLQNVFHSMIINGLAGVNCPNGSNGLSGLKIMNSRNLCITNYKLCKIFLWFIFFVFQ